MLNKLKGFKNILSKKTAVVTSVVLTTALPMVCHAADAGASDSGSAVSSMSTAFSSAKTDILSGLNTVAPYGIAIVVVFLVWKYGISFFKKLSK